MNEKRCVYKTQGPEKHSGPIHLRGFQGVSSYIAEMKTHINNIA